MNIAFGRFLYKKKMHLRTDKYYSRLYFAFIFITISNFLWKKVSYTCGFFSSSMTKFR